MNIYIDGNFYDEKNARVSVFDHGLLYGDGIFEGIRAYNGRVFKLKEHVDRLYYSAKAILLTIPISPEQMMKTSQFAAFEAYGKRQQAAIVVENAEAADCCCCSSTNEAPTATTSAKATDAMNAFMVPLLLLRRGYADSAGADQERF